MFKEKLLNEVYKNSADFPNVDQKQQTELSGGVQPKILFLRSLQKIHKKTSF